MAHVSKSRKPVPPYLAVGLSTLVHAVSERSQIKQNLETIEDVIHAAVGVTNINMPIKIIALAEGALTGFTDEVFDVPHVIAAREMFIEVPGEETDFLGRLAKLYGLYIIGQCKARWPEVIKDRYFNTMFIINPRGRVVHKAAKNHLWCRERSCTPHDVYDRWIKMFGDGIESFYPVLKTDDIGNIGTICCSDGEYTEPVRALALNGAEVVYRPSEAVPMTNSGYPGGGTWMVQNRGHAQFNSVYMLCPNIGPVYVHPRMKHPIDVAGGNSHIVDYTGNVISYSPSGANTMVAAIIDIEALRQFRVMNLNSNWLKDLRTELFSKMYDKPIHPKNLWLNQAPWNHERVDKVYRDNIKKLIERGTYTRPANDFPGARFQPSSTSAEELKWNNIKKLWKDRNAKTIQK